MDRIDKFFFATFSILLVALPASAQMDGMMSGNCTMCGAMGWGGMILGFILIVAIIAALGALTLYLFRKSQRFPQR